MLQSVKIKYIHSRKASCIKRFLDSLVYITCRHQQEYNRNNALNIQPKPTIRVDQVRNDFLQISMSMEASTMNWCGPGEIKKIAALAKTLGFSVNNQKYASWYVLHINFKGYQYDEIFYIKEKPTPVPTKRKYENIISCRKSLYVLDSNFFNRQRILRYSLGKVNKSTGAVSVHWKWTKECRVFGSNLQTIKEFVVATLKNNPDIVLISCNIHIIEENLNYLKIASKLRKGKFKNTIIIYSDAISDETRKMIYEIGVDGIIEKPSGYFDMSVKILEIDNKRKEKIKQ